MTRSLEGQWNYAKAHMRIVQTGNWVFHDGSRFLVITWCGQYFDIQVVISLSLLKTSKDTLWHTYCPWLEYRGQVECLRWLKQKLVEYDSAAKKTSGWVFVLPCAYLRFFFTAKNHIWLHPPFFSLSLSKVRWSFEIHKKLKDKIVRGLRLFCSKAIWKVWEFLVDDLL